MSFKQAVIQVIRSIPAGKVVSYSQVASACGSPRSARQVGWVLRSLADEELDLPWWRVINQKGYISIKGNFVQTSVIQKQLLEQEGVIVSEELRVDMSIFRHHLIHN